MPVKHICAPAANDKQGAGRHDLFMASTQKRTFIREWRKHRALTLERLAARVGVTHGTLSKIERGVLPYSQYQLETIAEALNTDPASLLMRNPLDPEGIWTVWGRIPASERARAMDVLRAFAGTASTEQDSPADDAAAPAPPPRRRASGGRR